MFNLSCVYAVACVVACVVACAVACAAVVCCSVCCDAHESTVHIRVLTYGALFLFISPTRSPAAAASQRHTDVAADMYVRLSGVCGVCDVCV